MNNYTNLNKLNSIKNYIYIVFCISILLVSTFKLNAQENPIRVFEKNKAESFPLVAAGIAANLVIDSRDAEVVSIATKALSQDIKMITGISPSISTEINSPYPVIIGTLGQAKIIDNMAALGKLSTEKVSGKWETFCISVVNNPIEGVEKALIIYGSDPRGTAYGIFEFSKLMGVSPWIWWADVVPEKRSSLFVSSGESIFGPPSVKYRGIFINDEDWGLQPWAAKNIDTDIKDIGPKTYEKVFELMLRLKANYLWPGMHPCTKAFWYYPENPVMARKYEIVLGASHCEPLLRNNVDEWVNNFDEEYGIERGDWNWRTNRTQIENYWADRVSASKSNDAIYTIGMRGIHDSGMPGFKTNSEKAKALKEVINVQRDILSTNLNKSASEVPQIFCPYKEALTLYQTGIDLPDDVTLLWADDNFGYIRKLSNPEEQLRSGGSGVYYHLSYWGRPQDYLWLSTTSPSLTSFEMSKAFALNAKKVWIFNIGDIKPNEMELQFAMDLAWDVNAWTPENAYQYSRYWAAQTFGEQFGESIGKIKERFYHLAASGKPEHIHSVYYTEKEINYRLSEYQSLLRDCKKVQAQIPDRLQDAYFELIAYPVEGATSMNEKILYARQSLNLAKAGDREALTLASKSSLAYQNIKNITNHYNKITANGKWDGMMDYAPRKLSHFYEAKVATEDSISENVTPTEIKNFVTVIPADEYVDINHADYNIKTIKGLGVEKSALSIWPLNMTNYTEATINSAPFVEYKVPVKEGQNTISVRCLPSFPLYSELNLRYAISVDENSPEFLNIKNKAKSSSWSKNVVRGYVQGESKYMSDSAKTISVRVYFADPGLVISALAVTSK